MKDSSQRIFILITYMHPAPSGEPGGLKCRETATSVNLTWSSPPKEKQNGVIIGYKVEVEGPDPLSCIDVADTNAKVDELRPNTKYIFKVSAKTAVGIGPAASLKCTTCEEGKIKDARVLE